MSFYVTLPSNSSMMLYTNNTLSNFTTKLYYPIKVNGPYEVGLSEFIFDSNWLVDIGFMHVTIDKNKYKIPIEHHDGETIKHLCEKLSNSLLFQISTHMLEINNQSSENSLVDITNDIFNKVPKIEFIENQILIKIDEFETFECEFEGLFADMLQITNKKFTNTENKIKLLNTKENLRIISTLYIYCDIIKYQYVGDSFSPLLRNIVVNKEDTNIVVFSSPNYVPINYTDIDSINIRITDEFGNHIKFLSGRTIVKLHFRPKRYGF